MNPDQNSSRPPEPAWVQHAMCGHVYPLGAVGADVRPGTPVDGRPVDHRLRRLVPWLDHVVDLGLNGLVLGPVFASSTHGYDTVDHFRVDPRLGTTATSTRSSPPPTSAGPGGARRRLQPRRSRAPGVPRALEEQGPDAPTVDLFAVERTGWQAGDPVPVGDFEGHDILVALDHEGRAAEDLVVEVMTHWLGRGIDGWRLDAAYAVPPAFWARVLPRVRERFPDAWFSGEVIHGDAAAIVEASTMDSTTQYELWQAVWHGIADRNCFELAHAVERHDALLETFVRPRSSATTTSPASRARWGSGSLGTRARCCSPSRDARRVRGRRVRLDGCEGGARGRRRRRPSGAPRHAAGAERLTHAVRGARSPCAGGTPGCTAPTPTSCT